MKNVSAHCMQLYETLHFNGMRYILQVQLLLLDIDRSQLATFLVVVMEYKLKNNRIDEYF